MENIESTQPQVDTAQPQADVGKETPSIGKPAETESQPFLTVKYLGQEKPLSADEAREYAERGMNYEKIKEKLTKAEQDLADSQQYKEFVSEIAQDLGRPPNEAMKIWKDSYWERKDAEVAEEKGITVEAARELRIAKTEAEIAKRENKMLKTQRETEEQERKAQEAIREELDKFLTAHPDIELPLPDGVVSKINEGIPLEAAYNLYVYERKVKDLEEKANIQQANSENAAASTGKLGGGAEHHPDLTEEQIEKMSPNERIANFDRIRKFLGFKD